MLQKEDFIQQVSSYRILPGLARTQVEVQIENWVDIVTVEVSQVPDSVYMLTFSPFDIMAHQWPEERYPWPKSLDSIVKLEKKNEVSSITTNSALI